MKLAKMQKINQACIISHKTTRKYRILLQKKILSTYSFKKQKYTTNTHIPFFLEEGGIMYYKKEKN